MQFFNLNFLREKKQPVNPLKVIREKLRSELQSLVFKLRHKSLILCSVINISGTIVSTAQHSTRVALQSDVISVLASVREVCKQVSETLELTGCSELKIFGDNRVFSMYSLDSRHVLVFFYKIGIEELCPPTDTEYKELSKSIVAMSETVRASVIRINAILVEISSVGKRT